MRLEELTILHLSDLHFGGNTSELVYTDLLSDIEIVLSNVKFLIILVSGDLVNKGIYKHNAVKVKRFFKKLKKSLCRIGVKKIIIEITAGNHDVIRPRAGNKYNKGKNLPCLMQFNQLIDAIYTIFGAKSKSRVGITKFKHNGKTIFLTRVDSSFQLSKEEIQNEVEKDFCAGSLSEEEKKTIEGLVLAQLKEIDKDTLLQKRILQKEYEKKVERLHNKRPALSIALSHYPLTWLNDTGREQVQDTLFKKGLAFVDIWISGHVHEAKSSYASENGKATVMLTTGIGRQDDPNTMQRYSVYRFCLDRNTSLVRVRRALSGRPFEDDPTFASQGYDNFHRLHILPIWSGPVGSIIRLNAPINMQSAAFYVDDSAVALVKEINSRLQILRGRIAARSREFVCQFTKSLLHGNVPEKDVISWLTKLKGAQAMPKVSVIINEEMQNGGGFCKFLKYICLEVVQALKRDWGSVNQYLPHCETPSALANIIWRAHFRYYLGRNCKNGIITTDSYKALCSENVAKRRNRIKNVMWGGVLKCAFDHPGRMLVSSANYGLNETKTKWDDFITIIPHLSGNDIVMGGTSDECNYKRPLLTFGISVKGNDFENSALASKCLYVLEYLNLCKIISDEIEGFLSLTGFNYVKFLRDKANENKKTY